MQKFKAGRRIDVGHQAFDNLAQITGKAVLLHVQFERRGLDPSLLRSFACWRAFGISEHAEFHLSWRDRSQRPEAEPFDGLEIAFHVDASWIIGCWQRGHTFGLSW